MIDISNHFVYSHIWGVVIFLLVFTLIVFLCIALVHHNNRWKFASFFAIAILLIGGWGIHHLYKEGAQRVYLEKQILKDMNSTKK
ncbi:hypothetical protein ACNAN0_03720 [Agrilactobacillus fermenti]|uniref:hypothetical protein n=1 Tax=Agrilactobacillus fermenti TaxID=2586909 RepID=UPI003A5BB7F8